MFCIYCGRWLPFPPYAPPTCPDCIGLFRGRGEKVSRDDSEDSSQFDTDSDSGSDSSSGYDDSSSYSSSEGSSESSGSGSSGADWGGGIVALVVIAICWFLASSKQAGYQEWTHARQTYQAAADAEFVRKQAFFKESKEVRSPPIGTFVYCRPLSCAAYNIGKTNPGDQVIVWNAGIEQKDTWDSSQASYLWFGYIAAIEKHGNRGRAIVAVLPEEQYPEIKLVLQQGADGSNYYPLYPRTTLIFKDDETRDAFYDGAIAALEAWRARFLPEARLATQTIKTEPEVKKPTNPEADSRAQIDPTSYPGLPQDIAEDLSARACKIPQAYFRSELHNAISGEFTSPGQFDWAVMCIRGGEFTVLLYKNGDTADPTTIYGPWSDKLEVMDWGSNGGIHVGYNRAISAVGKEFIMRHYQAYGGPKPPPIEHDGIDIACCEKSSETLYWHNNKWHTLQGAD